MKWQTRIRGDLTDAYSESTVQRSVSGIIVRGRRRGFRADDEMWKFRESGVTLDAIGRAVRLAIPTAGFIVVADLFKQDVEAAACQQPTQVGRGEGIGMSLVDSQCGQGVVKKRSPRGVDVDRQIQPARRRQHTRDFLKDSFRRKCVIDDVVDNHQRARPALDRQLLTTSGKIRRPGRAQPDETGLLSIKRFERIDGEPFSPIEKVDDADRTAADLEDSAAAAKRSRHAIQQLLEPLGAPLVPVELADGPAFDAVAQPFPKSALVLLRLLPPRPLDSELLRNCSHDGSRLYVASELNESPESANPDAADGVRIVRPMSRDLW